MSSNRLGLLWRDRTAWRVLCAGGTCPICLEGTPADAVASLSASWVTAPEVAPLAGYVAVVAKRHVVEPYDLPRRARVAFWEDVMFASKVLARLFRPTKMNYEIHGNTVPHLHAHLYPRHPNDPFVGGPIDPRKASVRRTPDQIRRIRVAFERAGRRGEARGTR